MRDNFVKTLWWKIYSCIFLFKNPFTLLFKGKFQEIVFYKVLWSDISAFLCALMFCFKGTVSQDFSIRFLSWIIFPQASENPQICGLTKFVTFVDLPPVRKVCRFEICGPNICCNLRICWPKFIAQIEEFCIFLLTNTYLKCSNSNFIKQKILPNIPAADF